MKKFPGGKELEKWLQKISYCFYLMCVINISHLKRTFFFEKVDFEKKSADEKKTWKISQVDKG